MSATAAALAMPAPPTVAGVEPRCAHCDAPLAAAQARFCCHGCEAAAELVAGMGLEAFYARRLAFAPGALRPASAAEDVGAFVRPDGAGRAALELHVEGLDCGACAWLVETALARDPAMRRARANLSTRRLALEWEGEAARGQEFADLLASLGFRVAPFDPAIAGDDQARREAELLRAMAVSGFAAANVMLLSVSVWSGHAGSMGPATRELLHWISALVALPAIAFAGIPFFRSAARALAAGRTNMDVPISIGVTLAAGMSLWETFHGREHAFFDSAVTLLFFLLVGRYLDMRARGRARQAAQHVVSLAARAVRVVLPDGRVETRRPRAVQAGDVVLVASGERVPVDGVVARGETRLDQSIVTGESMPVAVAPGDGAFAGSVNLGPAIELHTRAAGEGTLLAEIARLMEAAERGQGRFVALADRVARLYAPVVHVAGALTFLLWFLVLGAPAHQALLNAAAVLIITCPCALALAVPVVQVVASARLMRSGILVKSATALERLAAIDMVALDKTGTLTQGRPVLVSSQGAEEVLLAASMAQASRHPLSLALAAAAPGARLAEGVVERPGEGLVMSLPGGEVRLGNRAFCGVAGAPAAGADELELWLARPGSPAVRFGFRDELREDAVEAVAALRARGLELVLLSGDRPAVVEAAAARVGMAAREGGLGPGDKLRRLEALAARGRRVLMAGDGINDAPALAAAHASISPSSAADIARNAADFVFQGARLGAVVEAVDVARAARRLAGQNLALALAYNLLAVPLAVAGHVTPLVAAVAMSSSSLVVIANALRLSRGRAGP